MDRGIRNNCQAANSMLLSAAVRARKNGDAELAETLTKIAAQIPVSVGYIEKPRDDDHIMTLADFEDACNSGGFIDYDGFGHPMKDGMLDPDIAVYPSQRDVLIPKDATHIVWYNR